MSTSDQQGQGPLTRKQLREIRLTGSTPVISGEEAAAAAAAAEVAPPAPPLPRAAEPVEIAPVPAPVVDSAHGDAPLTRRQAREQEKIRTASVPVIGADEAEKNDAGEQSPSAAAPAQTEQPAHVDPEPKAVEPAAAESAAPAEILSALPDFSAVAEDEDDDEDEAVIAPVSASAASDAVGVVPIATADTSSEPAESDEALEAVLGVSAADSGDEADDDVLADVGEHGDDDVEEAATEERPTVNSAFGEGLLADASDAHAPFRPSFDDLLGVGDSTGSQHSAPNALIFTPSPGEGSLSGPVASTGEILVTGSYELPKGIGSQGHALGTADGKDVDAVLIDGELPPASSPTPIAASSAVSTIKPAGEVIRPPAPEKGNRLMLVLAIVAGGLALALGVALIFAFTTNVL